MAIAKPKVWWPLVIDATNNKIYFFVGASHYSPSIASATYASANALATAVQTAMNSVGGGTYTVTVDATGHLVASVAAGTFKWEWSITTNSAYVILGFFALDSSSALATQTAPNTLQNGWWSPVAVRADSLDIPRQPNSVMTVALGGQNKAIDETELTDRLIDFEFLSQEYVFLSANVTVGEGHRAIENWWRDGKAKFTYWPDATAEGTSSVYFLDSETVQTFKPVRTHDGKPLYKCSFLMRKWVS